MKSLTVRAAREGLRVPMERSRKQIGAEPVCVPDTQYYRRRLAAHELVQAEAERTER